eukprot:scaffold45581_cov73-Phaeocystis_antarctica.AAC.2
MHVSVQAHVQAPPEAAGPSVERGPLHALSNRVVEGLVVFEFKRNGDQGAAPWTWTRAGDGVVSVEQVAHSTQAESRPIL